MKIKTLAILITALTLFSSSALYAAPEQIKIKDQTQRTKERQAKSVMKQIDLRDIEDPASRQAIEQITQYLGLETKNKR